MMKIVNLINKDLGYGSGKILQKPKKGDKITFSQIVEEWLKA